MISETLVNAQTDRQTSLTRYTDILLAQPSELKKQKHMFVSKCLTSDSLVNYVARHGVYVLRQNSPVGSNALWCCMRFGLRLHGYVETY